MHEPVFYPDMDEETFQVLLDVMEKHFAALKILDAEAEKKLTRSYSVTDLPATRRIFFEQCYQSNEAPNLMRQFSCEQIFDKNSNTRQVKLLDSLKSEKEEREKIWQTVVPCTQNLRSATWNTEHHFQPLQISPMEPERMEVEEPHAEKEATTGIEKSEVSEVPNPTNPTKNPDYQETKRKLRSLVASMNEKKESMKFQHSNFTWTCFKYLIFAFPIFLAVFVTRESYDYIERSIETWGEWGGFNLDSLKSDFDSQMVGQNTALARLLEILDRDDSRFKVIVLLGGIGVGKSYTGEILERNFRGKSAKYFPPLSEVESRIKYSLSSSFCNLVTLEKISSKELEDASHLSRFLFDLVRKRKRYCLTILVMVNTQETNEELERKTDLAKGKREIESIFQKNDLPTNVVIYEPLKEEDLDKCIELASRYFGVQLTDEMFDNIRQHIIKTGSACKGAYAKVRLLS